ncbi:MAG: hypothetical protein ACRDWH_03720 [Acidimicrobiia bacterium]
MRVVDFGQEAVGIVAVGQIATGVVAIGQVATGVIAVGQLARGVITLGQISIGLVAVGQVGIGAGYGAGMLGTGIFAGGLVPVSLLGYIRFADFRRFHFRPEWVRSSIRPWRTVLIVAVMILVVLIAIMPTWRALFDVDGIFYVPPPRQ